MEKILLFFARYPVDFIAHISSIFPIVFGILRYKYLTVSLKLIWLLFLVSFVKDTYSLVLIFNTPNNLYIQNVEAIYQTALVGAIFYYSFDAPVNHRIIAAFTAICTLITLLCYDADSVSSFGLSTFRLFAIMLALAYFSKIMMDMRVDNIMKHSMFWFASGLLVYAAGTFFIMLLSGYWYQNDTIPMEVFDRYWNSSQFLLILFTLSSSVGLWFGKYDLDNLL